MATATKRVMAMAKRVAGNKEAMATVARAMAMARGRQESNSNEGNDDGEEGGRRAPATRASATATAPMWVMATATRLAGNE